MMLPVTNPLVTTIAKATKGVVQETTRVFWYIIPIPNIAPRRAKRSPLSTLVSCSVLAVREDESKTKNPIKTPMRPIFSNLEVLLQTKAKNRIRIPPDWLNTMQ